MEAPPEGAGAAAAVRDRRGELERARPEALAERAPMMVLFGGRAAAPPVVGSGRRRVERAPRIAGRSAG
jgi:hypothetical protein